MRTLLAAVLLVSSACFGDDLASLSAQADVVVVATPVLTKAGVLTGLSIEEWYKWPIIWQQLPPEVRVPGSGIMVREPQTHAAQDAPPYRGLWFLQTSGGDAYRMLPVRTLVDNAGQLRSFYFAVNVLPAQCPAAYQPAAGAKLTEKLALLLICSATVEGPTSAPGELIHAIWEASSSSALRPAYAALSAMPGSRQKMLGIAGLLSLGDDAGLATLAAEHSKITPADQEMLAGILYWTNPHLTNPRRQVPGKLLATLMTGLIAEGSHGPLLTSIAKAARCAPSREAIPGTARVPRP